MAVILFYIGATAAEEEYECGRNNRVSQGIRSNGAGTESPNLSNSVRIIQRMRCIMGS